MITDETYFPLMGRCPDCGRFMKRGLFNWMEHAYGSCPKAEYNNGFKDGMITYARSRVSHKDELRS